MKRRRALLAAALLVLVTLLATIRLNHASSDPASVARQAVLGGAPAFCDPALARLFAQPGAAGQTPGDLQVQVSSRSAGVAEVRVRGWEAGASPNGAPRLDWMVRAQRRGGRWCVVSITAHPTL